MSYINRHFLIKIAFLFLAAAYLCNRREVLPVHASSTSLSCPGNSSEQIDPTLNTSSKQLLSLTAVPIPNATQFTVADGLPPGIKSLEIDENGHLWGLLSNALVEFDGFQWAYHPSPNENSSFNSFYMVDSTNIWVIEGENLFHYDGEKWEQYIDGSTSYYYYSVTSVAFQDDQLWITTSDRGIFYLTDQEWHQVQEGIGGLLSNETHSIFIDNSSRVWVGTEKGLNCFDENGWHGYPLPQPIKTIWVSDSGVVWFAGSSGKVVDWYVGSYDGQWRSYETTGLEGWNISLQGDNDRIWIATERNGLFYIEDISSVQILPYTLPNDPIIEDEITDLQIGRNGELWVAIDEYDQTASRIIRLAAHKTMWHFIDPIPSLRKWDVRDVWINPTTETIWVAAGESLAFYRDNNWYTIDYTQFPAPNSPVIIAGNGGDEVWIGYDDQLLSCINADCKTINVNSGQSESSALQILSLLAHPKGLLVGTSQGVYWLNDNRLQALSSQHLQGNRVFDIALSSSGDIWYATSNGPVSCRESDCRLYTQEDGLYSKYIYSLMADKNERVWVQHYYQAASQGTSFFNEQTNEWVVTKLPSFWTESFAHVEVDSNGQVWGIFKSMPSTEIILSVFEEDSAKWQQVLSGNMNVDIVEDQVVAFLNGLLLVSENWGEMFYFDGATIQQISSPQTQWDAELPTQKLWDTIDHALMDKNGRIWVSSKNELYEYDGLKWNHHEIEGRTVLGIWNGNEDEVWIATTLRPYVYQHDILNALPYWFDPEATALNVQVGSTNPDDNLGTYVWQVTMQQEDGQQQTFNYDPERLSLSIQPGTNDIWAIVDDELIRYLANSDYYNASWVATVTEEDSTNLEDLSLTEFVVAEVKDETGVENFNSEKDRFILLGENGFSGNSELTTVSDPSWKYNSESILIRQDIDPYATSFQRQSWPDNVAFESPIPNGFNNAPLHYLGILDTNCLLFAELGMQETSGLYVYCPPIVKPSIQKSQINNIPFDCGSEIPIGQLEFDINVSSFELAPGNLALRYRLVHEENDLVPWNLVTSPNGLPLWQQVFLTADKPGAYRFELEAGDRDLNWSAFDICTFTGVSRPPTVEMTFTTINGQDDRTPSFVTTEAKWFEFNHTLEISYTVSDDAFPADQLILSYVVEDIDDNETVYKETISPSETIKLDLRPGEYQVSLFATDPEGNISESAVSAIQLPQPLLVTIGPFIPLIGAILLAGTRLGRYIERRRYARRRFNPYIVGKPITNPGAFYGRTTLLNDILSSIHMNSFLLYGERRIGKTSILHQLSHRLIEANTVEKGYIFYPVFIELQGVPERDFFRRILIEIVEATNLDKSLFLLNETDRPYLNFEALEDLETLVEQLKISDSPREPRIILLLDELDTFDGYQDEVHEQFRALFQTRPGDALKMVAVGVQVNQRRETSTSPWWNLFKGLKEVSLLTVNETQQLITKPVEKKYIYMPETFSLIAKLSDRKPMDIQFLCAEAINRMLERDSNLEIIAEDIHHAFTSLIQQKEGDFQERWSNFNETQREALRKHMNDDRALPTTLYKGQQPLFSRNELFYITVLDDQEKLLLTETFVHWIRTLK